MVLVCDTETDADDEVDIPTRYFGRHEQDFVFVTSSGFLQIVFPEPDGMYRVTYLNSFPSSQTGYTWSRKQNVSFRRGSSELYVSDIFFEEEQVIQRTSRSPEMTIIQGQLNDVGGMEDAEFELVIVDHLA